MENSSASRASEEKLSRTPISSSVSGGTCGDRDDVSVRTQRVVGSTEALRDALSFLSSEMSDVVNKEKTKKRLRDELKDSEKRNTKRATITTTATTQSSTNDARYFGSQHREQKACTDDDSNNLAHSISGPVLDSRSRYDSGRTSSDSQTNSESEMSSRSNSDSDSDSRSESDTDSESESESESENNVDPSDIAGITFPVAKTLKALRMGRYGSRKVGSAAPVYLAAVLEYLATEVLELAGHAVKNPKLHQKIMERKRVIDDSARSMQKREKKSQIITPEHIEYVYKGNARMNLIR